MTGRMCDRCDNPFAEATADGCVGNTFPSLIICLTKYYLIA